VHHTEILTVESDLMWPEKRLLGKALGIRLFEQRLLKLFGEGRLFGTVHTCIGQEWTGVAVAEHVRAGDVLFSNHRCHGHYLARTGNYVGLFAEIMGRAAGICGGRGGSQHICDANVFSNGIQGGIVPVAAGIAMAKKQAGTGDIVVVFIGDGTLGEGAVYESMNLASKWELPLLIVLENNLYAQSTDQRETLSGEIEARASAFGIETMRGDTWHPQELIETTGVAVERVRKHSRPLFLRVDTYRLMAHSKSDDNRETTEVDGYWERDVLERAMKEHAAVMDPLERDLLAELDASVEMAERSPVARLDELTHTEQPAAWRAVEFEPGQRMVNRIYEGLRTALAANAKVLLLGEDIEWPYGGAFKVTKDLSRDFPGRVRNTPISELAITGMANGMALVGMRPVAEIMFGDFTMLAADQWVNHAAKFEYMYNGQVTAPMVLRTPMGGKRGYGPTHSQSLEKHLLGVPGTRVLALHHRYDPASVYERLLSDTVRPLPTLVVENKILYGERAGAEAADGFQWFESGHDFPVTWLRAADEPDVTLVCYGGMVQDAERAAEVLFEEHDLIAEVVAPIQLYPLQMETLGAVMGRSGRLLLVEEGHGFCGLMGEMMARMAEQGCNWKMRRVASAEQHIPSAKPLEMEVLPGVERLVAEALELMR